MDKHIQKFFGAVGNVEQEENSVDYDENEDF